MQIVADANVLLAALIGKKSHQLFLIDDFEFLTTERTTWEVKKYLPEFAKKLSTRLEKRGIEKIAEELELSLLNHFESLPVVAFQEKYYKDEFQLAHQLIANRDPKDVDVLALVLKTKAPLWSQDKDFEPIAKKGQIKLLKTSQMLALVSLIRK